MEMTEEEVQDPATQCSPAKLIVRYLQENKEGATINEVLQYLENVNGKQCSTELSKTVQSLLESGSSLGFLERKGSRFMNWVAREMCCRRRRRSRRRRRRKRCNRRRRSCRRRRRCGR